MIFDPLIGIFTSLLIIIAVLLFLAFVTYFILRIIKGRLEKE